MNWNNHAIREIFCLIEGDSAVFGVQIAANKTITSLKDIIHEQINATERAILAKDLTLLKVDIDLGAHTKGSLKRLAIKNGDGIQILERMHVSEIWPVQPADGKVHIFVKLPTTTATISPPLSRSSNLPLYSPAPDHHFLALYQAFWQQGEGIFVSHAIQIPDPPSFDVGEDSEIMNLTVIDLPEGSERSLGLSKLLILPIYETFWDLLQSDNQHWQSTLRFSSIYHSTIVTGQSGIGKSVFLIYVLIRRLVNGMTTIYSDDDTTAHIFDNTGVRMFRTSSHPSRIPELDVNSECCALVNLGDKLAFVPRVFYPQHRKGRVVVATSPSEDHLSTFSHEHPASTYWMPTWKWGPLYVTSLLFSGRDLNTVDMNHCRRLLQHYRYFGGIPRPCLWSLEYNGLRVYLERIHSALNSPTFMDDFAQAMMGQLSFNRNASRHLVRVEPVDTNWLKTRIEIQSDYVAELAFKRIRELTKAQVSDKVMEYLADPSGHAPAGILQTTALRQELERVRSEERAKDNAVKELENLLKEAGDVQRRKEEELRASASRQTALETRLNEQSEEAKRLEGELANTKNRLSQVTVLSNTREAELLSTRKESESIREGLMNLFQKLS